MKLGPKVQFFSNLCGYQISWFACVLGGNITAIPIVGLFVLWHSRMAREFEWRFVGLFWLIGVVLDSLQTYFGVITFDQSHGFPIAPWLALLWLAFAMTLLHSLQVVLRSFWLSIVLAAIAAPLSYFAGERLGVISISDYGYFSIGFGWATLLGITSLVANRYGLVTKQQLKDA